MVDVDLAMLNQTLVPLRAQQLPVVPVLLLKLSQAMFRPLLRPSPQHQAQPERPKLLEPNSSLVPAHRTLTVLPLAVDSNPASVLARR